MMKSDQGIATGLTYHLHVLDSVFFFLFWLAQRFTFYVAEDNNI